jgi:sterol 3beta-glucosyltransferase
MVAANASMVIKTIVDTVQQCGVRAVICSGWSAVDAKKEGMGGDSGAIFYCSRVPHSWLFPRCAGVVHHGGVGTTAAGLRAGVPTAICSMFADQPFWGMHVHSIGVGAPLLEFKDLTTERLTKSIRFIQNPQVVAKAKALGLRMREEGDGVASAVEAIDGFVNDRQVVKPSEHLAQMSTYAVLFHFFPKEGSLLGLFLVWIVYHFFLHLIGPRARDLDV